MELYQWLMRFWEVPDRVPDGKVDLIVGFTLPQARDGSVSGVLEDLVQTVADQYHRSGWGTKVQLENRFPVAGSILGEVARARARELGVLEADLIRCPRYIPLERIRNTYAEATLAITLTDQPYRVLIVANHLHMRRALAAMKLATSGYTCDISWVSARNLSAYGANVAQWTFLHPLLFCLQEIGALGYSKMRGWA